MFFILVSCYVETKYFVIHTFQSYFMLLIYRMLKKKLYMTLTFDSTYNSSNFCGVNIIIKKKNTKICS